MGKRVIITVVDGLHYRYLIDAGVIEILADLGVEMLILTIPTLKPLLESHTAQFKSPVTISILEEVPLTRMRRVYLQLVLGSNKKLSETINFKSEQLAKQEPLKHILSSMVKRLSGSLVYEYIRKKSSRSFRSGRYEKLLREFRPDLVVFSTPGQKLHDVPLLCECVNAKIKTISPVYSWDNLTAKGPLLFKVDKLVVWNEIMRDEAIAYHGYKTEEVDISGVPVFDPYVKVIEEGDQKVLFRKSVDVNPDLPLITVTTIPQIFFGNSHRTLVQRLEHFMDEKRIPAFMILLRPHPKDETDYSVFNDSKRVKLDTYGSPPDSTLQNWIPKGDNITHLGRTMKYSDIVINIASTITIDAACFDTPVINVAYDIKEAESDYAGSIARFYKYTHYQNVVKSGAAAIVYSDEEMIAAINSYLQDRTVHSTERKNLVKQQTGSLDGRAHRRIADSILKMI